MNLNIFNGSCVTYDLSALLYSLLESMQYLKSYLKLWNWGAVGCQERNTE